MWGNDVPIKEANTEVLQLLSLKVDSLLMFCETESELRNYSLKFKLEQAVDKTAFQANRQDGEEMLHFQRVLQRMADLALQIAPHILRRTRKHQHFRGKFATGNDTALREVSIAGTTTVTTCGHLQRDSSVEEFCDGSEAWLEAGAHLSYTAVELLCLILVSHPRLVRAFQMYLFEHGVLEYIEDALNISREQEIAFFQEGHRTEHIRLIANLTLDNVEVCLHVVNNSALLSTILASTRFDEENPGMGEWAKFCIRNLTCCTSEAREKIRSLTPISISDESKELLAGKVDCRLNHAGKIVIMQMMPPRKMSVALRHRAHILSTSAEEQEAAIMEWRRKVHQDTDVLHRISSKIDAHKKLSEATRREERWLLTSSFLRQEAVTCELELDKAWMSCTRIIPEAVVKKRAEEKEVNMELLNFVSLQIMCLRNELQSLVKGQGEASYEVLRTLREKVLALRREFAEAKRLVDVEAEKLLCEDTEGALEDTPVDILQKLIQLKMETFARLCELRTGRLNAALVETYRNALQVEGDNAMSYLVTSKDEKVDSMFSRSDLRTVALILKTCGNELDIDGNLPAFSQDIYDRVRRVLPHVNRVTARRAVDEVQRQKRERLRVRSVTFQYRKRSAELLESFEKALIAEEEIVKMQNTLKEETKAHEESRQKTQKELERLCLVRDAKDAERRAEEEAKKREEAEKNQQLLCVREAEFQERLRQLREYQEQQRRLQEVERAVQQAIAEENALKKALQQERNAKRVEERKREYKEKCLLRQKRQQEVEELNAARKRSLENFFQGVERRLGVTCDTERLLQSTVSRQQQVPFVSLSEATQCVVNGYTADDLIKDPRFRLQLALLEAGLHQTSYGREVLSRGFHIPAAQQASLDNPLRMGY